MRLSGAAVLRRLSVATHDSPPPQRSRIGRRLPSSCRRLGGRAARLHGAALSRRRLDQSGLLRRPTRCPRVLRDTARYGVMAVGMTFVIVNKDLDLSVGSTLGLVAVVFSISFAPTYFDCGVVPALVCCHRARRCDRPAQRRARHRPAGARLHRHADHAVHRPRPRARPDRRQDHLLSRARRTTIPGSSGSARPTPRLQQPDPDLRSSSPCVGAIVLAKTAGLRDLSPPAATSRRRAMPASRPRWVRIRAYLLSALCATLAGADARGPGQGHHLAVRPGRRADRHRRGHRRRRLDPRRPRPRPRLRASARSWSC